MKLNESERIKVQDFVWGNHAHKEKKAAVQAAVIRYYNKLETDSDIIAFCTLCRLPKSWISEVKHCLLVAEKLKELSPPVVKK